jgi:hypothetical protein
MQMLRRAEDSTLESNASGSERNNSMTRLQLGGSSEQVAADAVWRGASARNPCPICGGSEGCFVHEEDDFVSCGTSPSDWPLTNGTWLHRFVDPKPGIAEQASSRTCVTYLMRTSEQYRRV